MANTSSMMVDFDDIEEGGGARVRVPAGDYRAKIKAVSFATSQGGNPMFIWIIVGTDGKFKGKELKEYTALTKKALWKLRDLMEAAGVPTPKKQASVKALLDYCKKHVVGKELGVTLGDDEFTNDKGKTFVSSKIQDYINAEDLDSGDDAEEDDDDVEDEDDADDGLDEMNRAELKAHIKAEKLDVKVVKSMDDDAIRTAIRAASDDEEEVEDVDLDDI